MTVQFDLPGLSPGPAILFYGLAPIAPSTMKVTINGTLLTHKLKISDIIGPDLSFHAVFSPKKQFNQLEMDVSVDGGVIVSDVVIFYRAEEGHAFVFRPGGNAGRNVYTKFELLVEAMSRVEGRKILEFDDSLVAPAACVIPAGIWAMKDVVWAGFGPRPKPAPIRTFVDIEEGAVFTNLRMFGGSITIRNRATKTSPISDFSAGNQVHIGLDGGTSEFQNLGTAPDTAPMFDLRASSAFFFIQNCLFGVRSTTPLIGQASPSTLSLFLLGLNQTGANLVRGAPGAQVLFGLQSSAATVGEDQSSITIEGGTYSFQPIGRIQRRVLPSPPLPAATQPVSLDLPVLLPDGTPLATGIPNAIIRCDGGAAFTQELPKIVGQVSGQVKTGFTIQNVVQYSGGQEIVVAEVEGGQMLKVKPFPGDKIDGKLDAEVNIAAHGSRTFVSDGLNNWITTSKVP